MNANEVNKLTSQIHVAVDGETFHPRIRNLGYVKACYKSIVLREHSLFCIYCIGRSPDSFLCSPYLICSQIEDDLGSDLSVLLHFPHLVVNDTIPTLYHKQ